MSDFKLEDPFSMDAGSSPSPSPLSSPAMGPIDSSPPSSPGIGSVAASPTSPGPSDPYAGSNKWTRSLKQYDSGRPAKPLGWDLSTVLPKREKGSHDWPHCSSSRVPAEISSQNDLQTCRPSTYDSGHSKNASASMLAPMDPYAASAHGTWKPPRREKKPFSRSASATSAYSTSTVLSDDTADGNLARSLNRSTDEDDIDLDDHFTASHAARYSSMLESEEEIWDMVIARAIETANGEIFLQNSPLLSRPLTYIPPSISDLADLVVLPNSSTALAAKPIAAFPTHRPFLRSATVPVSSPHSGPLFNDNKPRKSLQKAGSTVLVRTATSAMLPDPASTGSKSEIRLFLSNNRIKSLPLELFQLTGLTVLALRSNRISVLPSQIAQLTNLRELNIPTNKLRWLPSEMLGMHPMRLCVTNNPWIRPPPPDEDPELAPPSTQLWRARHTRASEPTRTHVSPTTVHFSIPPLTELCLRLLLSPVPGIDTEGTRRPDTVLEAYYALPFSGTDRTLPPTLLHTLRACLPSAVAKPAAQPSPSKKPRCAPHAGLPSMPQDDADEEPPPSIGVCPSPVHRAPDGGWADGRVPVFVRHAEERFTWEREVAGTDVKAECSGAGVPVRWRGCWKGCLDFLDPGQDEPQAGNEDGAMDVDGDVDVLLLEVRGPREPDGDDNAGVRIVQFSGGPISGFDDFE